MNTRGEFTANLLLTDILIEPRHEKSSENIQKKECGPDRSVSDNQSSSATLNKLAMNARKSYCNFKFKQRSHTMTDKSQMRFK